MKVEILQKLYNKGENSLNVLAKNYVIDDITDNEGDYVHCDCQRDFGWHSESKKRIEYIITSEEEVFLISV